MGVAIVSLVVLIVVGNVVLQIPLPKDLIGFAAAFLLGMSALFALGLLVAAVAPTPGIATAMFVPLFALVMFLGGVYLPRMMLPDFLIRIGDYTPPGVQALLDAWSGTSPQPAQLAVMAAHHGPGRGGGAKAVPLGMSASPAPASSPRDPSPHERWNDRLTDWCPYVTLAVSSVVGLARPGANDGERLVTAGLVGLAAVWVFLGYTRAPQPRKAHQLRMIVYFIGLLVIASALASREYIFFLFLITGFFHASVLRPWPVVFAGVFATSVLVNTVIGGFPTNPEWWTIYVAIIAIQTLVIGGGVLLSERMAEQSEQRRLTVARLEAALEENAGLHAQLLTQAREAGVLDERQRMAREIHDTIAQGLTGIVTQLEAADQASDRPEDWQRHVRNAIGLARDSLSEARRSVEGLRPEHLETARLPDALAEVARAVVGAERRARRGGHHGRRPAAPCRGRGGAVADGTGGVGQRREARQCVARLADAVLHGRRRDARRPGRRRRVHGVRRSRRRAAPDSGCRRCASGSIAWPERWRSNPSPAAGTAISARVPAIVAPGLVGRS